jgi:hypothetical protein
MGKTASSSSWKASYRYDDVYECTNGQITLSHSVKGLEAALAKLEADGSDFALKQIEVIKAKLDAIKQAGKPAPAVEKKASAE